MHISSWIIDCLSPGLRFCAVFNMHRSRFSNICDQCNSYMRKLLQRLARLRDNLDNMRRNPVYNNGCDCRFHSRQCTCDGPQMFTFRWVRNVGSQSSARFESKGTCGMEQILTSGSDSNKVMLEASCFGHETKLPTIIYFKVHGSENGLYASCSQPFNVDDVVCTEPSKGTLLLLDFCPIKGRTTHTCPGATFACGSRSYVVCNRGDFFDSPGSVNIKQNEQRLFIIS